MQIIKAYAKVNLRLKVTGINEINYHLLQMVNAKVSLYDELIINEAAENKVTFDKDELNNMENNICLNALNDFCNIYNINKHYNIYIRKNIPQGAGLGGGSCDVATIINYLNDANKCNLSFDELVSFGIKFGADIPYCLRNDICLVEGIGDIIYPLECQLKQSIVLVYPNIFSSTKEVYQKVESFSIKDSYENIKEYIYNKNYNSLFYNDLEIAAIKIIPNLYDIKIELSKFGQTIMSGSGSTFIVIPKDESSKIQLLNLKNKYKVFACDILN